MKAGNELAFPFIEEANCPDSVNFGLTKREYFAGLALQGMVSAESENFQFAHTAEEVAKQAVEYSDALLRALGEGA